MPRLFTTLIIACFSGGVIGGCTPLQQSLHSEDLALLKSNPPILVVGQKAPPFQVDTSGHAVLLGGVIGGAVGAATTMAVGAAISSSVADAAAPLRIPLDPITDPRVLVRSQSYEDPAITVRDEFVRMFKERLGLSNVIVDETPDDDGSLKTVSQKVGNGLVLQFRSVTWTLEVVPYSTDFWIRYNGAGLLFNAKDQRLLWTSRCGFLPREHSAPLSVLAANSGQGLKNKLRDIGGRCAKQLVGDLFADES